ncbi:hypothetical protein [Bradyrhizobium sp. DOA1]|uniref:hypothetical protein n=1 Tax=Bradyrhizobium sp. DOA1 TaxID=1126616 RepID=UPI00077C6065|nr:hypothetical protein [Bradyrhizobium sp. DOA1]KYG98373.1 hypothetical protein SE91_07480 [Bradyrhizobium sp. DOA1]
MSKRSSLAPAVSFRPSASLLKAIEAWMAQNNGTSLPEAIGRLIELGLTAHDRRDQQKLRARKMAGDAIDGMGDKATTEDARIARKQDLLNGPEEFDRLRKDRPSTTRRSKT